MILTIGNVKGGVGKSTLACNIAAALSLADAGNILLIDGDSQGSSSTFTEARNETLGHVQYVCIRAQGTNVLNQVNATRHRFKHIIIDAGGQDNASLRAALMASDKVLVPIPPRSAEIWALDTMAKLIEEIRPQNPHLQSYAVLNFAFPRGTDNQDAEDVLTEDFKSMRIIGRPIIQRKIWSDAMGYGLSILETEPRNMDAINEFIHLLDDLKINNSEVEDASTHQTDNALKRYA